MTRNDAEAATTADVPVLVVESDVGAAEDIAWALRRAGHGVAERGEDRESRDLLRGSEPSIVVLDVRPLGTAVASRPGRRGWPAQQGALVVVVCVDAALGRNADLVLRRPADLADVLAAVAVLAARSGGP